MPPEDLPPSFLPELPELESEEPLLFEPEELESVFDCVEVEVDVELPPRDGAAVTGAAIGAPCDVPPLGVGLPPEEGALPPSLLPAVRVSRSLVLVVPLELEVEGELYHQGEL